MPAPITGALCLFLGQELECSTWDGEVPRTDKAGNPINPNTTSVPSSWPVVKIWMLEPGFKRVDWYVGTDPYKDEGQVLIQMWATSKTQCQALMDDIEALLASESNWPEIDLGGNPNNPSYVVYCILGQYWLGNEQEGQRRTADSQLLYRGDMTYNLMLHGAVSTA